MLPNYDIYLYDINSGQERKLTRSDANQRFPRIWGTKVVFMDNSKEEVEVNTRD